MGIVKPTHSLFPATFFLSFSLSPCIFIFMYLSHSPFRFYNLSFPMHPPSLRFLPALSSQFSLSLLHSRPIAGSLPLSKLYIVYFSFNFPTFRLAACVSWCWSWEKEARAVEVKWHLRCTLEVFHVHSYQDQFIQPGWTEYAFCVFSLGLYFVYSFVFLWFVCLSPSLCFPGQLNHLL